MKYEILQRKNLFKNKFFDIEQVDLEIGCYDGDTKKIHRIALKRPAVAAVLLQIENTKELVLVEQFRYSAARTGDAWMLEIIAGLIEKGEKSLEAAVREVKEETGYLVDDLEKIYHFYSSAGISDQVMHIFFAKVSQSKRIKNFTELQDKEEDIKVCYFKKEQIAKLLKDNKIIDAKTIIALQWYLSKNLSNN